MADADDNLTPEQVAAELSVSTGYLAKMRGRGDGPPFERLGYRTIRYPRQGLTAWRERRRAASTSEAAA